MLAAGSYDPALGVFAALGLNAEAAPSAANTDFHVHLFESLGSPTPRSYRSSRARLRRI